MIDQKKNEIQKRNLEDQMIPISQGLVKLGNFNADIFLAVYQINFWLRLSPAIRMVWTAIGTALGRDRVVVACPVRGAGGDFGHPFDVLYTYGFGTSFGVRGCPAMRSLAALRAL